MRWFLIIIAIIFTYLTTTATCGIFLEIVQNVNELSSPSVSTQLETISDSNVSLTCKTVDSENKDYFDNDVVWCTRRTGLGNKPEILGLANLSFIPIKLRNQGKYFCASFKYNLYKIIHIVVKPLNKLQNGSKNKRRKRASDNTNVPSPNSLMYGLETTTGNLPIPLPTDRQHNFDWSDKPHTWPTEIKHSFTENQNHFYEYSSSNNYKGKAGSYVGVIIAIVGVIIVVGAGLYRLMKHFDLYAISPERISEVEPACQHPSCGQYCTFVGQANVPNHTHNANNGNDNNIPTITVLPSLVEVSNNSRARAEENAQIYAMDLPPSYDNYLKNCDKYNMPPSYSEALSNMSVNHLSHFHPAAQSNRQNLSRDT